MEEVISELERDNSLDYTKILKGIIELPFEVGRNLLCDFLIGDYKNKSIINNKLDELYNFGSLKWERNKILQEIDSLIKNGMIELSPINYNQYVKVLKLTMKGRNEIINPTLPGKQIKNRTEFKKTIISEEDKLKFSALDSFLNGYNDEQKKSIISESPKILCVAGAGSGKTTVLTKRIEFLVKYRGINPEKILAVTFTRKARQEMERRLRNLGITLVQVNTFNSFCERILRKHEREIYGKRIRVQEYADKILAMNMALGNLGIDMDDAITRYFTMQQRKFKTGRELSNNFINDCFSVMDYFKVTGKEDYNFSKDLEGKNKYNARMIYEITKYLKDHMAIQGLRDYSDQLIDAIKFLRENKGEVPSFEYILVDEYQDINSMQIELLELLNSPNFFAVGDPRQSIFGWRGSDISYILDFEKDNPDVETVHLTKNYRSTREIVKFMNHSIKEIGLPDLEHHEEIEKSNINILEFESEEKERNFVINKILDSNIPRKEIFVLARTNRQLMELSQVMKGKKIPHIVKTDEIRNPKEGEEGDITLATIHAIKGLEARKVFVIGCNEQNFPCKASDHPAIEMVKTDNYDKLEEERRLFYVAISRAKEILYLTYTGKKPTYFINDKMLDIIKNQEDEETVLINQDLSEELKSWRSEVSKEKSLPAYTIINNKTIEEISSKFPKTNEDLLKVDGIGPSKLVQYGPRILEIVRGHSIQPL